MYNSNNGILEFNPQNKFDTQKSTAKLAPNIFMKRNGSVPVADIGERLLVCDIVHKKNAHGAPKVSGGDGAKPLRAGSVPNLQRDHLRVDGHVLCAKVRANRGLVLAAELGGDKALHKGRLPHALRAEDHDFLEAPVKLGCGGRFYKRGGVERGAQAKRRAPVLLGAG